MSLFPIVDGRARFDASSNADSDRYSAGIRFTQEGAARSMTSAGTFFNQGIPMSESGQVALVDASSGLPVNVVWLSGLPISNDRVCISNKPVSVVSSGIPYDSAGAVAATVAPITTNATLDLVFAGVSNDLLNPTSYTLTTDFITPQYQVGAQYTVWDNGLVQKNFADIVTFTRASTATYFNSAGTLTSAAVDEARFDFNPSTLAAQGLLIEESRTNSIRNNTMVGAVAGTPGTDPTNWVTSYGALTQQIVGIGTENGIAYIDYRYSGTLTGSIVIRPDSESQIVASSGQAWTGSAYVKLVGGSLTNVTCSLNMRQGTAAGALVLNTFQSFTPTSAALNTQRASIVVASTQATTERILVRLTLDATGAIDITLRIGLPQLEQGAFATSVIPTTTTALTRSADVASVNTLSPWFNAVEGTLFAEITASANANTVYAALNNGTITQNSTYFDNDTGSIRAVTFSSGSAVAALGLGAIGTAGTVNKLASAYKVNDFAAVRNGGTVQTDALGAVPVSVSQLDLGRNPSGLAVTYISGYLRRITYYPRRLANADLQAITA